MKRTKIKLIKKISYVVMVWLFHWLCLCFFTLIFLEKRWNSGTHFDVQKYSHAKKVTWTCHGISPWMRDCIIDCSRQNSVASMQFIQFFATFWLWPISICFTKSPQKHATNRGEQQILQSIMMPGQANKDLRHV